MQTIVDEVSASLTYVWSSDLWRATSDPYWTIKKISKSGNITTTAYPCGPSRIPTDDEIFVWDRRAEYTYSLTPDVAAPTLTVVTIASDNSDTTKAKVWDTVTLTITASEALSDISATIAGNTATIADTGTNTYTASYVMASGDTNGAVAFTIDFTDVAWRSGTQVTATTDLSAVTFDKTAIAMQSGERLSNTVLRVTLTENANDATITHANDGGFVVFQTGTPATTYAVSAIAKSGSDSSKIELTIADATASAAVWLTITYVAGGNWVVADVAWNTMATDAVGVLVSAWA